jgi:hypothetical protein
MMRHISEIIPEVFNPAEWRYVPGKGYWTSENDGEEPRWVSPEEENEGQLIEGTKQLLNAVEIK